MRIRIQNFGGLMPKALPRALPDDRAQTAQNLDPAFSEFRPLANDTQVVAATGVTNPLTLYRLARTAGGAYTTDMTTNWVVRAADMNFVRGQNHDDTTERTYATFNSGLTPPRVYDSSDMVTGRQMGVPKATSAPSATVVVADEFTVEERAAEIKTALATAVRAIRISGLQVFRGAAHPGTGTSGYLDRTTVNGFDPADQTSMVRLYKLAASGGAISDTYGAGAAADFSWILDPKLQAIRWTSNGTTAWAGTGNFHIGLTFPAYAQTYDLDTGYLTTTLAGILMPGKYDGTKLFTAPQVTEIVTELTVYISPTGVNVKPLIDDLATQVQELKGLLDGGNRTSLVAITTAFYAKADVVAAFTAAIDNFANSVYEVADGVARSSVQADLIPGEAGS